MARYAILTLDDKIDRVKAAAEKARARYEQLQGELEELIATRNNERKEEILLAIAQSSRTLDEILEFIRSDPATGEPEPLDQEVPSGSVSRAL
jgi:hypothetical protein